MFPKYGSISCIHALSSIPKFRGGLPDGLTDGYVKIMPLVAPTPQLKLRWTVLSWSVGAECGKNHIQMHTLNTVFERHGQSLTANLNFKLKSLT